MEDRLSILDRRFDDRSFRFGYACRRDRESACGLDLFKRSFETYELAIRFDAARDRIVLTQTPKDGMNLNSKWRLSFFVRLDGTLTEMVRFVGYTSASLEQLYRADSDESNGSEVDANLILDDVLSELEASGTFLAKKPDRAQRSSGWGANKVRLA